MSMTKRWLDELNEQGWNAIDDAFDRHLRHLAQDEEPEVEELPDGRMDLRRPDGWMPEFNPNDCGGVYDGYGVISDADPGL